MAEKLYAFPMGDPTHGGYDGMLLRDWFAGGIAAALCSATDDTGMWTGLINDDVGYRMVADRSYRMADALLAARESTDANG